MIMQYSDSRTFKGLRHQIPTLSRTNSVFKDFPGSGKMTFSRSFKEFQGGPCSHPEETVTKSCSEYQLAEPTENIKPATWTCEEDLSTV